MSVERGLFPATSYPELLRMLLALDGSTTKICEALVGAPVELLVLEQVQTEQVPQAVQAQVGGQRWLRRVTSLVAQGQVLMDNLSLTCLDQAPDWFGRSLAEGQTPIGHLLERLFVRREKVAGSDELAALLWRQVGLEDTLASRTYRVMTPQGGLMVIFEVYREGMVSVPGLKKFSVLQKFNE